MEFICYKKCSTCQKAQKYLDNKNIPYTERSITDDTPTIKELSDIITKYSLDTNKLFNTSGLVYRSLNLKDKLATMSDKEKITLLASNGMLIKRPLLIDKNKILIGFKQKEWDEYFK